MRARLVVALGVVVIGAACSPVPNPPPGPTITGSLHVGSTLHVSVGAWLNSPTRYTYAWQSCDAASATSCSPAGSDPTYTLVPADAGRWIEAVVTAYNTVGHADSKSAVVGPVVDSSTPGSSTTVTVGSETLGISVPNGETVTASVADPATVPAAPDGLALPFGALDVDVDHIAPGSVAHIVLSLPEAVDTFRKLINGTWDKFLPDGTTGGTLSPDGKTLTLDVQDGGRGDSDGVANGHISDPPAPAKATHLIVTTDEVPFLVAGQPYGPVQLDDAGAQGPVTWSVASGSSPAGSLPDGLTLDPSGLISGTPTSSQLTLVDVQATDGSTIALQQLLFLGGSYVTNVLPPISPSHTGLPDGASIDFLSFDESSGTCAGNCPFELGTYRQDGTIVPETMGSFRLLRLIVGTQLAITSDGSEWVLLGAAPGDPAAIRDTDTDDLIATLALPSGFQLGGGTFSPDGEYVMLNDRDSALHLVFDAHSGALVKLLPVASPLMWSPDSKWLLATQYSTTNGGGFDEYSVATDQAGGAVGTPGYSDCSVVDWSQVTNRLLLGCGLASTRLMTASTNELTDGHTIMPGTCAMQPCWVTNSFVGPPHFSPTGAFVTFGALYEPDLTVADQSVSLVTAPDSNTPTLTPLFTLPGDYLAAPIVWH